MALPRFEPMTVGRILDQAFRLYRESFLRYVTIAAVVQVPSGLLMVAGMGLFYSNFTSMAPGSRPPESVTAVVTMMVGLLVMMAGAFLLLVSMVLAMAAMARSMSASYLGGDLTVAQAYRSLLPRAGWLFLLILLVVPSIFVLYIALIIVIVVIAIVAIGVAAANLGTALTALAIGLIVLVATLVLTVLVLAWGAVFSLSVQSVALEDLNTFAAIGRSVKLIRGNLRKALGSVLLTFLLVFIPAMAAASLGFLLDFMIFGPANVMALQVIQQSVSLFMQVLVMPVWAAAMLLLYYDLRIRKEGFDLEMLARSFRPGEPAPDTAAKGVAGAAPSLP
jgi:hypothetical protein